MLRKEYEKYKDQWGLNLKYTQEAGASKNYSKILTSHIIEYIFLKPFVSAAKIPLKLQVVHIYFDSSTYDKVEKDAKVKGVKLSWNITFGGLYGLDSRPFVYINVTK